MRCALPGAGDPKHIASETALGSLHKSLVPYAPVMNFEFGVSQEDDMKAGSIFRMAMPTSTYHTWCED